MENRPNLCKHIEGAFSIEEAFLHQPDDIPPMQYNLEARCEDSERSGYGHQCEFWRNSLMSNTILLYDGKSKRFKIDHDFERYKALIAEQVEKQEAEIKRRIKCRTEYRLKHPYSDHDDLQFPDLEPPQVVRIDRSIYDASEGTEFRIITFPGIKLKIDGRKHRFPPAEYAIRADFRIPSRLEDLRGKISRINAPLRPHEVIRAETEPVYLRKMQQSTRPEGAVHKVWLELAVGKNHATPEDYERASELLQRYVIAAQNERGFFDIRAGDLGMSFEVPRNNKCIMYPIMLAGIAPDGDALVAAATSELLGNFGTPCTDGFLKRPT